MDSKKETTFCQSCGMPLTEEINATYWGNQVMAPSLRGRAGGEACYGIACCEQYILVSEYGKDGADAKLVMLKRR